MLKYIFYIFFFILCKIAVAQDRPKYDSVSQPQKENSKEDKQNHPTSTTIIEVKHIHITQQFHQVTYKRAYDSIQLDRVILVAPFRFKDRDARRDYLILRYKVKEVWPYAVLAADRLMTLRKRLDKIKSAARRQQYTKMVQKYIEGKFKERLKNLSKSEGQILVKLMYRQTGETTYELIRELRSGWRAFWYNVTANMFTISLKEEYDPYRHKQDYYIEHILRRAFQKNELEYQAPAIPIDYLKAEEHWDEYPSHK